jgi:hypothetical protein
MSAVGTRCGLYTTCAEKVSAQLGYKIQDAPPTQHLHLSHPECDTMQRHAISPKWDAFECACCASWLEVRPHTATQRCQRSGRQIRLRFRGILFIRHRKQVMVIPLFNFIARFDPPTYPSAYTPFLKHNALCMSYFCLLSTRAMSASQYAVHLIRAVYHIRMSESAVSY